VWRYIANKGGAGALIDFLLYRKDRCMNLCELKFSAEEFIINKNMQRNLHKKAVFIEKSKTKKTVFLTMVNPYGILKNEYYKNLVQNEVTMDALFE
jgi:uncharacterized protein